MVGIISYGVYIPRYRLKNADIARVWGKTGGHVEGSLGIAEKSIAGADEDAVTIGYEAAWRAVKSARIDASQIDSVFVGSESHPYAVNPTTTTIAEFLGVGRNYFSADLQFACKAATTGLIVTDGLIQSGKVANGLVIGADAAQAKPHDALEYTAASAGVAIVLSNKTNRTDKTNTIAVELIDYTSYSSDTPDFWRRDGISYPSHGGRFTGEPAYFTHVLGAGRHLLEKTKMKPENFAHCVFHMPNSKFPRIAAKRLGFTEEQLKHSLTVEQIGNPYSASSLLGFAATLDVAKPNRHIFMVSYGSGAGADAFIWKTTSTLPDLQKRQHTVAEKINYKTYVSYTTYLKMRGVI